MLGFVILLSSEKADIIVRNLVRMINNHLKMSVQSIGTSIIHGYIYICKLSQAIAFRMKASRLYFLL